MSATQLEADAFISLMARHFSAHVVRPHDAAMNLIQIILDLAVQKKVDIEKFMLRHPVSIGPFVYLPDGLSPDDQIYAMTHECEHVHQFQADKLGFTWLYLSKAEVRTHYECDAYGAEYELRYARTKILPPLEQLVWPLEVPMYLLGQDEIEFGKRLFASKATSIASGVFTSYAGRAAIKILKEHNPRLLHEDFR